MAYVKTAWADRVVEFAHRYKDQDLVQYTFTADPGTITDAGTLVSAALLNHIEQGIYDATYPAYIDNATSPNNCRIAMADAGITVSRNINDANTLVVFNKILGTGLIADFKAASVTKFSVNANGNVISNGNITMGGEITTIYGMRNTTSINNAKIYVPDTGAIISRNVADANSALVVNQIHASSTGKILDLQWQSASVFSVSYLGGAIFGGTAVSNVLNCRMAGDYGGVNGYGGGATVGVSLLCNAAEALDLGASLGFGSNAKYSGLTSPFLYAVIRGAKESATATHDYAGYLAFYTQAASSATAERMRITSTGKVGIGCVPTEMLEITGNIKFSGTINTYTLGTACAAATTDFMAANSGQFRACTDVKTAAYNIAAGDYWILCGGSGDYDVTLPTAVGRQGQVYIVQRVVGGTNVIRVATTSSQTINGGAAPLTLSTSIWTTKMFISDGANWKQAVSF